MNYNIVMEKAIKYDVVIIGGGTSGCSCAYNCAKFGLKTLLVEKNNFLGGLMTGGLVVPVMKSSAQNINCEYYNVLVNTAKKYNAQITYKDKNDGWFNPECLKIILDDILNQNEIKNNLDILFETTVLNIETLDKKINKAILISNMLSLPIVSKYYIDATGSGEFSILAGCEKLNDNNMIQQNTLRFILNNVDFIKFKTFLDSLDDSEDITNTYRDERNTRNEMHFTTASTWDENQLWKLDKYLQKGVKDKILHEEDRAYIEIFSIAATNDSIAFNCPTINNYKDNPFMSSLELINARKSIWRIYNFCKIYFPGFEHAQIANIATQTGIREQNRIKTRYIYTKDDLTSGKTFKNPVLKANYSIDIHSDKKNKSILQKTSAYELPLEALMSYDYDNLFIIGKALGADFYAHSALRVQKSCMSMGEGVAKYLAKSN